MGKKLKKKTFRPFDNLVNSDVPTIVRNPSSNLNTSGSTPTNSWNTTAVSEQNVSHVRPRDQRRDIAQSNNATQGDESWSSGNCSGNIITDSNLVESLDNVIIDNPSDITGILEEHTPNTVLFTSRPNQSDMSSCRKSLPQNDKYISKKNSDTISPRQPKLENKNYSQYNKCDRRRRQKEDELQPDDATRNLDINIWPKVSGKILNVNAEAFKPDVMPELSGNIAESNDLNEQSQQNERKSDQQDFNVLDLPEAKENNSHYNRNMRKKADDWRQHFNDRTDTESDQFSTNQQDQRKLDKRGYSVREATYNISPDNQNMRKSNYPSKRNSLESQDTSEQNKSSGLSRMARQSDPFNRSSENVDKEYKEFEEEERKKNKVEFIRVTEIEKDLFAMPNEFSLAHCVAEDMRMGSGIAVNFRRDFKDVDNLLNQRQKQGGLATLELAVTGGIRYIYYLVTKRESTGKPTYLKFWSSIKKMRDHIHKHQVKKLAIPKLGCGLDRLEWSRVKHMIEFLFKQVDVEIVVCNFQQSEDAVEKPQYTSSCKVVHVKKPIADIDNETCIIYLSTENAHISTEMEQLDKKFAFLQEFKRATKTLGDVIKYEVPKRQGFYMLYGCIVRKTNKDPLDFVSLRKCVVQINKNNKKDGYFYVAYQAIEDNDDLINEKIITILRNYITKNEIYVCWDGDLAQKMPYSNRDSSFN